MIRFAFGKESKTIHGPENIAAVLVVLCQLTGILVGALLEVIYSVGFFAPLGIIALGV